MSIVKYHNSVERVGACKTGTNYMSLMILSFCWKHTNVTPLVEFELQNFIYKIT